MSEETKDPSEASEAVKPAPKVEGVEPAEKADTTEPDAAEVSKTSVQHSEDDAALDAAGRERPRFLLGFPKDPDLARLAAAFEAGNYALVRAEAEALAERTDNRAVRDAALELRRRIAPDPLAKYLLGLTAALLLSLAYFAYHH